MGQIAADAVSIEGPTARSASPRGRASGRHPGAGRKAAFSLRAEGRLSLTPVEKARPARPSALPGLRAHITPCALHVSSFAMDAARRGDRSKSSYIFGHSVSSEPRQGDLRTNPKSSRRPPRRPHHLQHDPLPPRTAPAGLAPSHSLRVDAPALDLEIFIGMGHGGVARRRVRVTPLLGKRLARKPNDQPARGPRSSRMSAFSDCDVYGRFTSTPVVRFLQSGS